MTDPWADVRAKAKGLKAADEAGARLAPIDFALIDLVADADALLAVVPALEAIASDRKIKGADEEYWARRTAKKALAALPSWLQDEAIEALAEEEA